MTVEQMDVDQSAATASSDGIDRKFYENFYSQLDFVFLFIIMLLIGAD